MKKLKTNEVTKHTRVPRSGVGKPIICPNCGSEAVVYHFVWLGLGCNTCKKMVDKYDWIVPNELFNKTR